MQGEIEVDMGELKGNREVRTLALVLAEKLQLVSPSAASVHICLGYGNSTCEVRANKTLFTAQSAERDPQAALLDLDHQIMLQVTAWKTSRYFAGRPQTYEKSP